MCLTMRVNKMLKKKILKISMFVAANFVLKNVSSYIAKREFIYFIACVVQPGI